MRRGADLATLAGVMACATALLLVAALVGGMSWVRIIAVGLFGLGVLLSVRPRRASAVRR